MRNWSVECATAQAKCLRADASRLYGLDRRLLFVRSAMRQYRPGYAIAVALVCVSPAWAGDSAGSTDSQKVIVVNAAPKLASFGPISRLRRVLDSRNLLVRLSERLEATLDGREALIGELGNIKDAYANGDFDVALKIIEATENRILEQIAGHDPTPALVELSQWRGLIAVRLNQRDEALRWFRAVYRFNPAWTIDAKLVSPAMRSIIKKAKIETTEIGTLRIAADPPEATIAIDGGEAKLVADNPKIQLATGTHLLLISAPRRKPYAELIEIKADDELRIDIALDGETRLDRAARLVDETVAAPSGKSRLEHARALATLTGHSRMLFIEDGGDDHVLVRLYDVESKKVSKVLQIDGHTSSAAIAREIVAALEPENVADINTIVVATQQPATPWYKRWYVWAAVGAIAVGSVAGYAAMSHGGEPMAVRGF